MTKLVINPKVKKSKIHKEIYGHFSEHLGRCIYEGLYVGENSPIPNVNGMRTDVVEALKEMKIPVLRWPGGCFADEYHWKDGIGPKEDRKKIINTHWGGVVEDNSFGTHEFFELCRQLGCEAYVNGNVGSGTVQEMSEWVEYMTFDGVSPMADLRKKNGHEDSWDVAFFGVGNENWGCGGNMTPEFYGNEYRRYQTYVRDYKADKKIYKIACGANVDDYEWTERVLHTCFRHSQTFQHGFMDGLSLHYYTHPEGWDIKGSATDFDDRAWYKTLSKTLKMLLTPTYHVFNMYKYHQDAELLESHMDTKTIGVDDAYHVPNMTESVSVDTEGVMHLTITNLSLDEAYDVDALILEKPVTEVKGEILAEEMHAMNTFEEPENVKVKEFKNVKITDKGIAFTIPACSILHLAVK